MTAQQPTGPPAETQQPGNGAQVQTGTSQGLNEEVRIQNLLADHQYFAVEQDLGQLPPEDAQLFRGVLANRRNDLKQSIALLEPLVERISARGDAAQEKLLRKALAEDFLREGDWEKASKAYQALDSRLSGKMTQEELDEIELPLKLLPLVEQNPQMTVDGDDPFVMQVNKDPLGLTDVPVFVDARPHSWMLDPTLPFNLVSRSLAKEAGLKVSDNAVSIHSLTGKPMQMRMTVIPRFTVGGRITFHNMTAFVFEDADYHFHDYQVEGALGYPALKALGSLKITAHQTIEVQPMKHSEDAVETGAPFYLDGDQVIVASGVKGDERMFVVDAAGQQTYLTSRYFDEHASQFEGQKMELFTLPSAPTLLPVPAYRAETVQLHVGSAVVQLHDVRVLTQPAGLAAVDDVYGVLGMDALDQLRSYRFDYRTMQFKVEAN